MNLEQKILQIPIENIIPNRFQPRLKFDDRGLEELSNSIRQHGIIQPLVVRRLDNDKYEIIAGERRYKAAGMAGLKTVPAVVADIDNNKSAEVAIVENVQRRDLSAIEEARSYKNLLDKGYLTQSELAKKMGISQSAIANKLRLLNLDEAVQEALINNEISERHARSLLVLNSKEEQKFWLDKIIKERMTVRELDDALKEKIKPKNDEMETDIPLVKPLDIEAIKNSATELPSVNDEDDILRKIEEIEREKKYNPDIIPVDQANNESKTNFFNFLENETVNMNMDDNELKAPPITLEFNPEPAQVEAVKEEPQVKEEMAFMNNQSTPEQIDSLDSDTFNPLSLVDTLDPNYKEKVEEKLGIDLKTAINDIREVKDNLTAKGFNISLEETDLTDYYQFIIKVKKD